MPQGLVTSSPSCGPYFGTILYGIFPLHLFLVLQYWCYSGLNQKLFINGLTNHLALKLVNRCFRGLNKPTKSMNASVNILCNFPLNFPLNICKTSIILSQQQGQVCLFSIYLCMQNQSFVCIACRFFYWDTLFVWL